MNQPWGRRGLLLAVLCGVTAFAAMAARAEDRLPQSDPATPAAAQRLNVLLITADDLGPMLECYGDAAARTPQLDALAARGRLFQQAYVAQASCSPSRSAMFTGLYPHANGQYGLLNAGVGFQLHQSLDQQTIPALLKQAGYRTGILGKLHVGVEDRFPFDVRLRGDTRDVRAVAEQAGAFLREQQPPFFLMVNYSDPHVMGRSPRPPKEAFPTQYKGVPADPLQVGDVPPLPFQRIGTEEQIERVTQYYNAVQRVDHGVGLLLEQLQQSGHAAQTLILFVGDHGPPFMRGKTSCYEGGVRVPMLACWPGVFTAGERSDALVSTVDLLPTILDGAQLAVPSGLHGRSLRHTLDPAAHRRYLATEFHYHGARPFFPRRAIRDDRFKLIHNLRAGQVPAPTGIDGDRALQMAQQPPLVDSPVGRAFARAADPPEFELYDLQSDPWEFNDLADDPAYARMLQRLQEALMQWRSETDDPLLTDQGYRTVAAYEAAGT